MKKNKKIIFLLIVGITASYLTYIIWGIVDTISVAQNYKTKTDTVLDKDYYSLFTPEARSKFINITSNRSPNRHPVTEILFDNNSDLIVYKLETTKSLQLNNVPVVEKKVNQSVNVTYKAIEQTNYFISYQVPLGQSAENNGLFLTFGGDSIQRVIADDSTLLYDFKLKNLSLSYGEDMVRDLYLESKRRTWMNLMLMKRHSEIYLLVLTSKNSETHLPQDILYRLTHAS